MASSKPLAIDLFSGCGGLTQGLKNAGFTVMAAIELDALAVATYKLNHPRVNLVHADIRKVDAKELRKKLGLRRGNLNLLAACPPCQGFSAMKTRNGGRAVRDRRNELIADVTRFIDAFLPRHVMLENVPGLAKRSVFKAFLIELDILGYSVSYDILDAADYGVPQRRKRLILIASRTKVPEFGATAIKRVTVRDAIGHLPHPRDSEDELHSYKEVRTKKVRRLIRKVPVDGGSRQSLGEAFQLPCHKTSDGFRDVYGRMAWSTVAPTLTSGCINPSKGRFLHPRQHRAITLREAALLQGFPKAYRFDLSRGRYAVAEMIGNALPPEFIRRHAISLRD